LWTAGQEEDHCRHIPAQEEQRSVPFKHQWNAQNQENEKDEHLVQLAFPMLTQLPANDQGKGNHHRVNKQ
jgi:hypothetical protein